MWITYQWLKDQNACMFGLQWFKEHYPNGGDHKEIYKSLQDGHKQWGYFLLAHIGKTELAIRVALSKSRNKSYDEWAHRWLDGSDRTPYSVQKLKIVVRNLNNDCISLALDAAGHLVDHDPCSSLSGISLLLSLSRRLNVGTKGYLALLDILDECDCMKKIEAEERLMKNGAHTGNTEHREGNGDNT